VYQFANPQSFDKLARVMIPASAVVAIGLLMIGLYFALALSPADYQQGDSVRIMYVHVPAAWMALFCYTMMAAASFVGFVWKHPLADVAAKSTAPLGAVFTALALVTGSLWGKPMWGTWWAWDARLTSVLILLFLYLGYMALWQAIDDKTRAARLAAIVCIVGFVNIPIIKFSVDWWNSLHQPASIMRSGGPAIHGSMLTPLLIMAGAYMAIFVSLLMISMRSELIERRLERYRRNSDDLAPRTLSKTPEAQG